MMTTIKKRQFVLSGLFLVMFFCTTAARAYEPIYTDGKKWLSTVNDARMGYKIWQEFTEVIGDTVIGGETAKIIDCWRVPNGNSFGAIHDGIGYGWLKPRHYHYYRIEEEGKVYDVKADGTKTLIMDFASPVGTTWEYGVRAMASGQTLMRVFSIVNIDTFKDYDREYRRLTVLVRTMPQAHPASDEYDESGIPWEKDYFVWVEGVGELCNFGLLGSDYNDYTPKSTLNYCVFPSIYRFLEAKNINPVIPPAAIESVSEDVETPDDGRIYDISGREVKHPQKGNIYIRGGRKVVWGD